jgi:Ca2+:H+ antiporter
VITYSWINLLLVCNPIAWALHYAHQKDEVRVIEVLKSSSNSLESQAIFAVSLLGIIPLAGLLSFGTESIALYCGDALGGKGLEHLSNVA